MNIFKKSNELQTVRWSGGTTTELMVFPEDTSYKDRNFTFRISTSTVNTEVSEFTVLPGVARHIIVLDGAIRLEHIGHHSVNLEKFETDYFQGEWQTISHGRCIDFNLMTRGVAIGLIQGKQFKKDEVFNVVTDETSIFGIYLHKGNIKVSVGSEIEMTDGDFFLLKREEKVSVIIYNIKPSELVLVYINKVT